MQTLAASCFWVLTGIVALVIIQYSGMVKRPMTTTV
jgi:hypothetical protein